MTERKLTAEDIEKAKLAIESFNWVMLIDAGVLHPSKTKATIDLAHAFILKALHDLEAAESEVERLQELAAWRKAAIEMLIDCANNHALDCECPRKAQAALEGEV